MPPSKYRPRKLEGETQTYNVVFQTGTLDALRKFADDTQISPATFVRGAVEEALALPTNIHATVGKISGGESYADGVADACAKVAKNSRLALKMSNGNTMGEDIAKRILKDLVG
jgi:hypothetical protein